MKQQFLWQFLPFLCSVCIRWLGTDCEWSVGVLSVSESGMTIFRPSFHNCIDKAQASWQETQVVKFFFPIYFLHSSFKPLIVVICVGHVIWALFLGLFGFSFCHFHEFPPLWSELRGQQVVCVWQGSLAPGGVLKPQQWLELSISFISLCSLENRVPNDHW